jgi:hypothetical protein
VQQESTAAPVGFPAGRDSIKERLQNGCSWALSAQPKKFVQSEIGALKDIHENANRNAANDLIRHDQMVVHRKIKRLERPDTNINNDLQTTSAGKKIVKTVQSEESNYEESNYNKKTKYKIIKNR